jgi:hypothetical protein
MDTKEALEVLYGAARLSHLNAVQHEMVVVAFNTLRESLRVSNGVVEE